MKLRALTAGTALTVTSVFAGSAIFAAVDSPPAAAARPPVKATATGPCTVTNPATNVMTGSTCTLRVTSVQVVNHTLQAAGTLTVPGTGTGSFSGVPIDPPASCSILALTLGPLHLDLLGLVVDLNQVNLNITAVPGPGNLLGNLLCGVANLLNNTGTSNGVTALVNNINSVLAAA